ncbi:chaperone protein dnaJ 11, chloroplastic-like [Carica papaya]|uniref:chaperone protein dnaJ 11, chloroplastic-like n=1 Tax=Carica papaya TaxID=3649 RepID=UPI000B8CC3D2|nr:chaperone protein dnaJ 11, chloroplastic-like [Carica papaya]
MYSTLPFSLAKPVFFPPGASHSPPHAVRFGFRAAPCRASVQTFAAEAPAATIRTRGSLYEVLRVKETASFTEIKTAYRSLAKVYHPDASESDGNDFIQIHNAYATLSDPTTRMRYDLSLVTDRRPKARYSRAYPTRTWETDQCW